jgi:hypothetical protein
MPRLFSTVVDADAAFNVSLTYSLQPESANHVYAVYGTIRHNEVTDAGEMRFQPGCGYEGQWYIYWVL